MPVNTAQTFPPISDYGLIGDCRTVALISRDGAIDWLCLPDIHSPSVFGALLDRERGGSFRICAPGGAPAGRSYREDTNILETEFAAPDGRFKLIDFMPVDEEGDDSLNPEREIIRIIECTAGTPEVEIHFAPRPDYARKPALLRKRDKLGWVLQEHGKLYLLRSSIPLSPVDASTLHARTRLKEGERITLTLIFTSRNPAVIAGLDAEITEKLESTESWWRSWLAQCKYDGPFAGPTRRSVLALKLLEFSLSGAVSAAATTSLPESIGGQRNWDYRYCWLRDASFFLRAFTDIGFETEGASFFDWLMHSTRLTQPKLKPLYDVYGRTDVGEFTLDHLFGYRGSRPVRVGNAAAVQTQLDVYGAVVSAACDFVDRGNRIDASEARLLIGIGKVVCNSWQQPDSGIWEFRGRHLHNTYSKIMCWSALNDLLKLADEGHFKVPRRRFEACRAEIGQSINTHAYNAELNSFVGAYGETFMDATLLLMPRRGFIAARDPRMVGTWQRIQAELEEDGLLRRYTSGIDDFPEEEGAFLICTCWAIDYLARIGRIDEAKERLEVVLSYSNDLGLFSEEVDAKTGDLLGNFPQAFSHSGIINSALIIEEAEKSHGRAGH
jgi:GH15 family glucan-1,4-alpha-glucosidase